MQLQRRYSSDATDFSFRCFWGTCPIQIVEGMLAGRRLCHREGLSAPRARRRSGLGSKPDAVADAVLSELPSYPVGGSSNIPDTDSGKHTCRWPAPPVSGFVVST
jgi:hypothetical protein